MFQTFSGSSRRSRNVNLSGQNRNPFAAVQQTSRSSAIGGHSAVAQAQQERKHRQLERERQLAARTVQRYWRGHIARRKTRQRCRDIWDQEQARAGERMTNASDATNFDDPSEISRARLLGWFVRNGDEADVSRVCDFYTQLLYLLSTTRHGQLLDSWGKPMKRISRFALGTLDGYIDQGSFRSSPFSETLLRLVAFSAVRFPNSLAGLGTYLYSILAKVSSKMPIGTNACHDVLMDAIISPLRYSTTAKDTAYEGFVLRFMTFPQLQESLSLAELSIIAEDNYLARKTRMLLNSNSKDSMTALTPKSNLLWAMAYFVSLHRQLSTASTTSFPNIDFVAAVSMFLSQLEDGIRHRQNIHDTTTAPIMPKFVETEISSLINQESIMSLFAHSEFRTAADEEVTKKSEDAAILASYALVLLQAFPRRADEIRGWIYMSANSRADGQQDEPAIKYFWRAVQRSSVYQGIHQSFNAAIKFLKPETQASNSAHQQIDVDQEWRVVFLFLELYTFMLKIMDDDEFMTGNLDSDPRASWTRQSALELSQVREFTTFLKNLAFAMYWNVSDILETKETVEPHSLANYFGQASNNTLPRKDDNKDSFATTRSFAGVQGMTIAYMKGMVTGLLRMLYERDSRRHFCKPDHWLMKEFEMKGFIEAVVMEQAFRDKQDEDTGDEDEDREADDMELDLSSDEDNLIGTTRTQQIRRLEKLRTQQQKSSRQKLLKNLTPRLEILQNMPFFIPFTTRVEIFREFVTADQLRRRNGFLDPDQWRLSVAGGIFGPFSHPRAGVNMHDLGRHSAKVRREHLFDDAFNQFYELGEGFKEPIQITFVDQFDTPEAGIDGGGVTKEFLTSVTSEAFSTGNIDALFVENDQHLLYPNPSAMDERREVLRSKGISEGSIDWNLHMRELLKQYEFLGRVVGKCLYEGILEDIHFAPFFLVKWALTGGLGAAANESGYRANINDLRDLDEELYQNLLKLKNYPGNVDDFALDFTITDITQRNPDGSPKKSITRELRSNGSQIPVTNANRLIYISAVARHRLQSQPAMQTNAFLRGLSTMIQPAWLSMFNQSELQTLLGGDSSEIDVADLRANTLYGGVYTIGDDGQEHPTVQQFWSVLDEMGDSDRRKVLKYVTSTPRGPLLGFAQLNPRFSIRDSGSDQSRLPSTSTCVNLLKLPIYKNKSVLKEKLLYAVNAGAGFNLS